MIETTPFGFYENAPPNFRDLDSKKKRNDEVITMRVRHVDICVGLHFLFISKKFIRK